MQVIHSPLTRTSSLAHLALPAAAVAPAVPLPAPAVPGSRPRAQTFVNRTVSSGRIFARCLRKAAQIRVVPNISNSSSIDFEK